MTVKKWKEIGRRLLAMCLIAGMLCGSNLSALAEETGQETASENSAIKNLKVKQEEQKEETTTQTVKAASRAAAASTVIGDSPNNRAPGNTTDFICGGEGTRENPYRIYNQAELEKVSSYPNAYFRQVRDITMSATVKTTAVVTGTFAGVYDGNGYSIVNLKINGTVTSGVFEILSGTIKNLGVKNPSIVSTVSVGGIAGSLNYSSVIQECWILGGTIQGSNAGSIAGQDSAGMGSEADEILVKSCYSTATVRNSVNGGGIVGSSRCINVDNCYFAGTLTGNTNSNPVSVNFSFFMQVVNCYYDKTKFNTSLGSNWSEYEIYGKTTEELQGGGFVSRFLGKEFTEVKDSYPHLNVEAIDYTTANNETENLSNAVIIQGEKVFLNSGSEVTLELEMTRTGKLDDNNKFQWYKDGKELSDATDTNLKINPAANTDSGKYYCKITNQAGDRYTEEIMVEIWEGNGTAEFPYLVYTAQDFDCVRYNLSAHYLQMKDISFHNQKLDVIGGAVPSKFFSGVYDGGGNTLKDFSIGGGNYRTGLFSTVTGTVKNLVLDDCSINGANDVAAFAGWAQEGGKLDSVAAMEGVKVGDRSKYAGGLCWVGNWGGGGVNTLSYAQCGGPVSSHARGSGFIYSTDTNYTFFAGSLQGSREQSPGVTAGVTGNHGYYTGITVSGTAPLTPQANVGFDFAKSTAPASDPNSVAYFLNAGRSFQYFYTENGSFPKLYFQGDTRFLASLYGGTDVQKNVKSGASATQKIQVTKNSVDEDYTFRWYKDGAAAPAVTTKSKTFVLSSVSPEDAGVYNCVMSNASGYTYAVPGTVTIAVEKNAGTETSPYQIKTADDFKKVAKDLSAYYELANDIDFANASMAPIAGIFEGQFNGNGHTFKNLNVTSSGKAAGLFEQIGKKGTVKNLGLSGGTIKSTAAGTAEAPPYLGGIAGENRGEISNCYADTGLILTYAGSSAGGVTAGGIAGFTEGGKIEYCYARNQFAIPAHAASVLGGIAGTGSGGSEIYYGYFSGTFSNVDSAVYPIGKLDESCFIDRMYYNSEINYGTKGDKTGDKQGIGKTTEQFGTRSHILADTILGNKYYLEKEGMGNYPKLAAFKTETLKCVEGAPADVSAGDHARASFLATVAAYNTAKNGTPTFTYEWNKKIGGVSTVVSTTSGSTELYNRLLIPDVDEAGQNHRDYTYYCKITVTYADASTEVIQTREAAIGGLTAPGLPSFAGARTYWDKTNVACQMIRAEEERGLEYIQLQYRVQDQTDWKDVEEGEVIVIGYEGSTVQGRAVRTEDNSVSSGIVSFIAKKDATVPVLYDNNGATADENGGLFFEFAKVTNDLGQEENDLYEGIITVSKGTTGKGFYDEGGSGIAAYYVGAPNDRSRPAASADGWLPADEKKSFFTISVYENGAYYIYLKDQSGNISTGVFIFVNQLSPNGIQEFYYKDSNNEEVKSLEVQGKTLAPKVTLRQIDSLDTELTGYESNDTTIATVDSNGIVTGISYGTVKIRIYGTNSNKKSFREV